MRGSSRTSNKYRLLGLWFRLEYSPSEGDGVVEADEGLQRDEDGLEGGELHGEGSELHYIT